MSESKGKQHRKKRILFFTPYSGRTGSEIMLYSILRHLDSEQFDIQLVSMRDGELVDDEKNNFRVHSLYNGSMLDRTKNFIRKKITGLTNLEKNILTLHHAFQPDMWYLNTIVMPEVAEIAVKHKIPFAVHFHELQTQYNLVSDRELELQLDKSAFLVGCSTVVCDAIKLMSGKTAELLHECIDFASVRIDENLSNSFRTKNNIPDDHRIVLMSGQRSEIKGLDIFLKVAEQFKTEKVHFVWLGASRNSGFNFYYEKYAEQFKETITFSYPDPVEYYSILNSADLFFLSSHSDPFPLVMIEAAFLGKYIVALNSGGVAEFCDNRIGTLLSRNDVGHVADEIRSLLKALPANWHPSQSKARALEFDVKIQAEKMAGIFHRKLN